jgi:hypothetical protein
VRTPPTLPRTRLPSATRAALPAADPLRARLIVLHACRYSFMFACFPLLVREIPGCTTFKVGPFALSDRPFYYIIGLQLAVNSAPQRWAALCGLVAGMLYLLFGRRAFSVPGPIARCALAGHTNNAHSLSHTDSRGSKSLSRCSSF